MFRVDKCLVLPDSSCDTPSPITTLSGKQVINICCGSTYSAAITANGDLYTWGRGNYGRLGHGSSEDQSTPLQVAALKGQKVIDVSAGSGDAQTMAVTEQGKEIWACFFSI